MTTDHTPAEAGTILAAWQQVCRLVDPSGFLSPASIVDRVAMLAERVMASVVPGDTATEGGDVRARAIEAVSWAETMSHGRLGYDFAEAAVDALAAAGLLATAGTEGEAAGRGENEPEPLTDLASWFRAAADGRREYAENAPQDQAVALRAQASTLDGAARLAAGDREPLYWWLPSWRWPDAWSAEGHEPEDRAASPQGEAQGQGEDPRVEVLAQAVHPGAVWPADSGPGTRALGRTWARTVLARLDAAAPRAVAPVGNVALAALRGGEQS